MTGPAPDSTEPLVAAEHLVKSYGSFAVLSDATFTIPHGITGLLGANGSGKTTLLGLILGLHAADGGRLTVLGHDPRRAGPEVRARLGYAPEHHTLPGDVLAADFVRHVAELHGIPKAEATTRASDALWLVGLGEERFRAMGTMSTGQRQRVKLAQAIAHDPLLILLDEPTDGLDPMQRTEMLALIRRVATEYGMSIIFSSHLLDEVEAVCDAAVIIADGRVQSQGTLGEITGTGSEVLIEVATAEQAQRLAQVVARQELAHELSDRRVVVIGHDDSVFDVARDACVAAEVAIESFSRRRLSLEDVMIGTSS